MVLTAAQFYQIITYIITSAITSQYGLINIATTFFLQLKQKKKEVQLVVNQLPGRCKGFRVFCFQTAFT